MFIKVVFPYKNINKEEVYISNEAVSKGEILVVKENNKEKLGLVYGVFEEIPNIDKINGIVVRKADVIDKFDFWRLFEKKLLRDGVKLTCKAFESYKMTNGNFETPLEIAEKKMARNLLLSYKPNRVYITNNKMIGLQYGAMRLYYRNGAVHKIENHTKYPKVWKKNPVSYTYFSKLLGIEGL